MYTRFFRRDSTKGFFRGGGEGLEKSLKNTEKLAHIHFSYALRVRQNFGGGRSSNTLTLSVGTALPSGDVMRRQSGPKWNGVKDTSVVPSGKSHFNTNFNGPQTNLLLHKTVEHPIKISILLFLSFYYTSFLPFNYGSITLHSILDTNFKYTVS